MSPDDLRVGIIARADNRGLAHMTWEMARHISSSVCLVELAEGYGPMPIDRDRYNDLGLEIVQVWRTDGEFHNPDVVKAWLQDLDVLYTAETPYDWRLFDWAREAGVATVLHAMPELLDHAQLWNHPPTVVWAPTHWRLSAMPQGTIVVPVPVATDRFYPVQGMVEEGRLQVLHVAGKRAMADRNGTRALLAALENVTMPMDVTITTQDGLDFEISKGRLPTCVGLSVMTAPNANYWDLYRGHELLVLPRRYGGLCLPAQEAAAAGLALVMTDVEPNAVYPATLVATTPGVPINAKGGVIPTDDVQPGALARTLDMFADDRGVLAACRSDALRWAQGASWASLEGIYRRELYGALLASQRV